MRVHWPLIIWMCLISSACLIHNHDHQASVRAFEESSFFPDGSGPRIPPEGTVPRKRQDQELGRSGYPKEYVIDESFIRNGMILFQKNCAVCHGFTGEGNGIVTTRGLTPPPDFLEKELMTSPPLRIYQAIQKGQGRMPSYARRLDPKERWQIAAFIKALQLSRNISIRRLNDEDRKFFSEEPAP